VQNGHSVTLFANAESRVPCSLAAYVGSRSNSARDVLAHTAQIAAAVAKQRFNLIHSFGRLAYLLPLMPLSVAKVMSYQRGISLRSVAWGSRLSRGTLHFTACSRAMIEKVKTCGRWHVVYNAVGADQYQFRPYVAPDAPLMFLGRVERIK